MNIQTVLNLSSTVVYQIPGTYALIISHVLMYDIICIIQRLGIRWGLQKARLAHFVALQVLFYKKLRNVSCEYDRLNG